LAVHGPDNSPANSRKANCNLIRFIFISLSPPTISACYTELLRLAYDSLPAPSLRHSRRRRLPELRLHVAADEAGRRSWNRRPCPQGPSMADYARTILHWIGGISQHSRSLRRRLGRLHRHRPIGQLWHRNRGAKSARQQGPEHSRTRGAVPFQLL